MEMETVQGRTIQPWLACAREYWALIKSPQTGLLLATGLTGYMSARCPVIHWTTLLGLAGSLFLAISGSTLLNMWYDRDIDACMCRTARRPLPSGRVSAGAVFWLGMFLSILGVGWAVMLSLFYGLMVFAGLFFDVVIYSMWLKRRTCWSIVWGGISGGMPILAGRVLALDSIDWTGILLSLGILFWIPTHILTFSIKYFNDYQAAGVPTFPSRYGLSFTRAAIAVSSVSAALVIGVAAFLIGMQWGFIRLLAVLSGGLLVLAAASYFRPTEDVNLGLFKYASMYMLGAMLLITLSLL